MIHITKEQGEIIDAIEAGRSTTGKIAGFIGISGSAAFTRISKLKKKELIRTGAKCGRGFIYHYTDKPYKITGEIMMVSEYGAKCMAQFEAGATTALEVRTALKEDKVRTSNAIYVLCEKGLLDKKPNPAGSHHIHGLFYAPTGVKYEIGTSDGRRLTKERVADFSACDVFNNRRWRSE